MCRGQTKKAKHHYFPLLCKVGRKCVEARPRRLNTTTFPSILCNAGASQAIILTQKFLCKFIHSSLRLDNRTVSSFLHMSARPHTATG